MLSDKMGVGIEVKYHFQPHGVLVSLYLMIWEYIEVGYCMKMEQLHKIYEFRSLAIHGKV